MWYALHHFGPGFHRSGEHGQDLGMKRYKGTEDAREKLWAHTQDVVKPKLV
jgi:hypothetical protein